jgi:hypothetical protein
MLMAVAGTDTEQAADGAVTEQGVDERSPTEGREPIVNGIVARKGDSALLLERGFRVTERATS